MAESPTVSPETCAYCGAPVDDEHDYRYHLHTTHSRDELGSIDRRRYDAYEPQPGVISKSTDVVVDSARGLRYPVDAETTARHIVWATVTSVFIAAVLGVGL